MNEFQVVDKENDSSAEEKQEIDQIRKLLFGEFENSNKEKVHAIEQQISELEAENNKRFQALTQRLDELSRDTKQMHQTSMVQLGEAIVELGQRISSMGRNAERTETDAKQSE